MKNFPYITLILSGVIAELFSNIGSVKFPDSIAAQMTVIVFGALLGALSGMKIDLMRKPETRISDFSMVLFTVIGAYFGRLIAPRLLDDASSVQSSGISFGFAVAFAFIGQTLARLAENRAESMIENESSIPD